MSSQLSDFPDQPDGIEEDSSDLPNPQDAARRVLEYVEMSGDGLYDVCGGCVCGARLTD